MKSRLSDFLLPVRWEIGAMPNTIQIQNEIQDISGILYIRNVMMSVFTEGAGGMEEVDMAKIRKHRYILPRGGEHEIVILVENDVGG